MMTFSFICCLGDSVCLGYFGKMPSYYNNIIYTADNNYAHLKLFLLCNITFKNDPPKDRQIVIHLKQKVIVETIKLKNLDTVLSEYFSVEII